MTPMERVISACGIYDCLSCDHMSAGRCPGCGPGNEAVRRDTGSSVCRVYECVRERGIAHCGECTEQPCLLRRATELVCPLRGSLENERWWAGKLSRALESRGTCGAGRQGPSEKVVNRLRWYLKAVDVLADEGRESISSWQLAERVGVSSALIRKDLSKFGEFGTPSYGYRVEFLRERLRSILGLSTQRDIIWIGAGALRLSPIALRRLQGHGCELRGVFDTQEAETGSMVGGLVVRPIDEVQQVVSDGRVAVAVLAVQGPEVHRVAALLAENGVGAILNLSGELLVLPSNVHVVNIDLVGEILEMCYYCR